MPKKLPIFAAKLRELRERKGMTIYALAKRASLTVPTVSNLDGGRSQPNWETVQVLCAALGVSCDEFADPAFAEPAGPLPGRAGRPKKKK